MRTVETIDREIAELELELQNIRGTETEIYTRIVGYYRSLRNWNKGKREEYDHRIPFAVEEKEARPTAPARTEADSARREDVQGHLFSERPAEKISAYSYFYRKSCPNCQPVRDFVSRLPLDGTAVDVDSDEGLSQAMNYGVLSTPTVVFFDDEGRPVRSFHSVSQMESLFVPGAAG